MLLYRRTITAGLLGLAACPWSALARGTAPAVLLANVADAGIDPAPYLVSEKYDGVRALWDGERLRFRSGRQVHAPRWFVDALPAQKLDGELWIARGRFDAVSGIVRKNEPVDAQWAQVRYMVFELPDADGSFADRHERLRAIVKDGKSLMLQAVMQQRLSGRRALASALDDVVRAGGEGLMLHRADAPYVTGRSGVLLKLKRLHDSEAVVMAHVPGQGKYAGMMGALEVQTPAGLRFRLGTGFADELRHRPPPIGSTITYTFRDLTPGGVPRFASYLRPADDL